MARIVPLPTGLTEEDRQWIDTRIHWLVDEFGEKLARSARIARPDQPAFQSDFGGVGDTKPLDARPPKGVSQGNWSSEQVELVQDIAEEVADFCGVNRNNYEISVLRRQSLLLEPESSQAEHEIEVQLEDNATILELISDLAAQMALIRLSAAESLDASVKDLSLLAELFACLSGLGICMANADVEGKRQSASNSRGSGKTSLSTPMIAYALAVFAWLRDEDRPKWERLLDRKTQGLFAQSQAFLGEHGMHDKPASYRASFFNGYVHGQRSEDTKASELAGSQTGYADERETESLAADERYAEDDYESETDEDEYEEASEDYDEEYETGGESSEGYEDEYEEDEVAAETTPHRDERSPGYRGEQPRTSARKRPAVQVGQDMDMPDASRWMLQFFLLVIGIAIVLFVVNSLGGD